MSFTSATPGICTVSGNSATGVALGTCTINANEAGSIDTSAAPQVSQSFPVVQATQSINFPVPGGATVGMTVNLSATASSGLPVSFTTSTPTVCSVSGNTATGLANGYCYVLANQAGNTNIGAAPQVRDYFSITAPQSTPTVVLTSPTANTTSGKNLVFSATALAPAGGDSIVQVAFYNGPSLLGTVTQPPFTITIPDLDPGTYTFTAQSTEAYLGNVVSSAPVTVTILPEGAGGATTTGTQTIYAIYTDQLDTPRMVADQTGNVVWQWDDTDPYGNNLPNQDPNGTGKQYVFNLRHPGQYADVETGMYYNGARDYNPLTGGYLQSDPLGIWGGGFSTYGYAAGNPTRYIDPTGRCIGPLLVVCVGVAEAVMEYQLALIMASDLALSIATDTPSLESGVASEAASFAEKALACEAKAASGAFSITESVAINGTRAIDMGKSYEGAVRGMYNNATSAERSYSALVNGELVDGIADDVAIINSQSTAIEAKYVDSWEASIRNPNSPSGQTPWGQAEQQAMVNQAMKYSAGFAGGVIYHTNSPELAAYYTQIFNLAGITNFRFVITPAVKP